MILKLLGRLAFGAVIYTTFVIGPVWLLTGSFDWPRGWLAIAIILSMQLLVGLWLLKTDPDLLRERLSVPSAMTWADRFATMLIILSMLGWFVLAAIDVHRLHLIPAPHPNVSFWSGLGLFALGTFIIGWTFRKNAFAAPVVKIQHERKHHVIDTGPYAFVRHPMYAGLIPLLAGLGLIMESSAMALASLPMVITGVIPRMIIEEATLRRKLVGYDEYLSRVRWRLVPGLL